jgi:CDP-diglyceride synthetase
MAKALEEKDSGESQAAGVTASDLDERTHAEMLMMYHECATSVRFAKLQQWHTTGGTLIIFLVLGVLGNFGPRYGFLTKLLPVLSILLTCGTLYSLAIYQFWQHAERNKLVTISNRFSSFLREVRALTSPREANIHRYILLFFMIAAILVANWVLILYLSSLKYL